MLLKILLLAQKIRTAACKSLPAINSEGNIVPLEIQETSISIPQSVSHITAEASTAGRFYFRDYTR